MSSKLVTCPGCKKQVRPDAPACEDRPPRYGNACPFWAKGSALTEDKGQQNARTPSETRAIPIFDGHSGKLSDEFKAAAQAERGDKSRKSDIPSVEELARFWANMPFTATDRPTAAGMARLARAYLELLGSAVAATGRRQGHSALRVRDGKLEVFDPHPPADVQAAAKEWAERVNALPVVPPSAYEGFLSGAAWALSVPSSEPATPLGWVWPSVSRLLQEPGVEHVALHRKQEHQEMLPVYLAPVSATRRTGYMGDINGPGCDPDVP